MKNCKSYTMKTIKITLIGLLLLANNFQARAITYLDYGSCTNYSLAGGDMLNILSGVYTGTITNFGNGALISIAGGATFAATNFPNNAAGTINNYGTCIFNSSNFEVRAGSSINLNNYGQVFGHNFRFGSGNIYNGPGASIRVLDVNYAGLLDNYGTFYADGDLKVDGNGNFTNRAGARFYMDSLMVYSATMYNYGYTLSRRAIHTQGGPAVIYNECTMISLQGLNHTGG